MIGKLVTAPYAEFKSRTLDFSGDEIAMGGREGAQHPAPFSMSMSVKRRLRAAHGRVAPPQPTS